PSGQREGQTNAPRGDNRGQAAAQSGQRGTAAASESKVVNEEFRRPRRPRDGDRVREVEQPQGREQTDAAATTTVATPNERPEQAGAEGEKRRGRNRRGRNRGERGERDERGGQNGRTPAAESESEGARSNVANPAQPTDGEVATRVADATPAIPT